MINQFITKQTFLDYIPVNSNGFLYFPEIETYVYMHTDLEIVKLEIYEIFKV